MTKFPLIPFLFLFPYLLSAGVPILKNGEPQVQIVPDLRNTTPAGAKVLNDAANWLAQSLHQASDADFQIADELGKPPAIVISKIENWPAFSDILKPDDYNAYTIVTRPKEQRVYILGNSAESARYGVSDLLLRWGFRFFAPSPRWHVAPNLQNLTVDLKIADSPELFERRIWYAYGMSGNDLKPLMLDYQRWAIANRLTLSGLARTGHSYGSIVGRNKEAFANNPELSAMKPDGTRDTTSVPNARKFCVSNPDLLKLVAEDRWKLLQTNRTANPDAFMVSVDPSDGEGTCHCEDCKKIGTTTDRVIHLANQTAKSLRAKDPNAWVGLYAYSSHRLPPTIPVEPNVYVQVALGFNRTQYSLPELVSLWSKKVSSIGLREYYGVEAWDWGLPGRARGGRVGYHKKWIPYYAERNLNGINAETNANWGAQALGLYVASQLLWKPSTEVEPLVEQFMEKLFGKAAHTMRGFYEKMEAAPQLRPSTLLPLFRDLQTAAKQTTDPSVQARLSDLQAYLVYVSLFRDFELVRGASPEHGDAYHDSLKMLMNYAWRIRHRDIIHYYALARRLCNALPLKDGRPEYSIARGNKPIWQTGEAYTDQEIQKLFDAVIQQLENDGEPAVHYSRYLDPVKVDGKDAGPAKIHSTPVQKDAISRFRSGLKAYLIPSRQMTAKLGIAPTNKPVTITVFMRSDAIFEKELRKDGDNFHELAIELPRAFEYHVEIKGEFVLRVPPETPFIYEASPNHPAWVSYSGPHYFYVPAGTREIVVDASPRISLEIPGQGRNEFHPAERVPGKSYISIPVPKGSDGQLWHTHTHTRGQIQFLNIPPLLSLHRNTVFVPRELSESEGLGTKE